jgi:putative transposase
LHAKEKHCRKLPYSSNKSYCDINVAFGKSTYARYYLPSQPSHIHPDGYPLFITFRLADSLPKEIVLKVKLEREQEIKSAKSQPEAERNEVARQHFIRYDDWLDSCAFGPRWMEDEKILKMDNNRYKLIAYCIMSNHLHMLIEPCVLKHADHKGKSARYPVAEALRLLKGSTGRECNMAIERSGHFWHHESYDHFVRDENELTRTIQYILNNPVKAGLAKGWKFTYINPEYGEW